MPKIRKEQAFAHLDVIRNMHPFHYQTMRMIVDDLFGCVLYGERTVAYGYGSQSFNDALDRTHAAHAVLEDNTLTKKQKQKTLRLEHWTPMKEIMNRVNVGRYQEALDLYRLIWVTADEAHTYGLRPNRKGYIFEPYAAYPLPVIQGAAWRKRCTGCGKTYPPKPEYYFRNFNAGDGYSIYCKECDHAKGYNLPEEEGRE